jgi:hypothetical protein
MKVITNKYDASIDIKDIEPIYMEGKAHIHIDVRFFNENLKRHFKDADGFKAQLYQSINRYMQSIWYQNLNLRFGLLIDPKAKTAYEQWIVDGTAFNAFKMLNCYNPRSLNTQEILTLLQIQSRDKIMAGYRGNRETVETTSLKMNSPVPFVNQGLTVNESSVGLVYVWKNYNGVYTTDIYMIFHEL